jgi:hypothetical protein
MNIEWNLKELLFIFSLLLIHSHTQISPPPTPYSSFRLQLNVLFVVPFSLIGNIPKLHMKMREKEEKRKIIPRRKRTF